ncbi:Mediator of RNA polymerase II transcription subunit 24 [Halotydeus destructor]|nr:Mediator of RNA polymerase II transcription subunit 24 [Halotydeus destructor]
MDNSSINHAGGTSKSIKSLLLDAWRERWSEIEWGTNLKKVLPRGVSGDVYDMADCILQQSLVGPIPNTLMVSYLKHSICSRTISYGAVLLAVSRYDQLEKHDCISCLLDIVKQFKQRIGCHGNEEECISLCKAIVALSAWLFSCLSHYTAELKSVNFGQAQGNPANTLAGATTKQIQLIEKVCDILAFIANSPFMRCLFYIGKAEDPVSLGQLCNKMNEMEAKPVLQLLSSSNDVTDSVLNFMKIIQWNYTSPYSVVANSLTDSVMSEEMKNPNKKPILMLRNIGDSSTESNTGPNCFIERSPLIKAKLKKIVDESPNDADVSSVVLNSKTPFGEIIESEFSKAYEKSRLDNKVVLIMSALYKIGGVDWFVESLVRQFLKYDYPSELSCAISLTYGLLHIDIEQCTLSLISNIVPNFILDSKKQELLIEPKASALSRLVVMTIYAAMNSIKKSSLSKPKRKSSNSLYGEPMDVDEPNVSSYIDSRLLKSLNRRSDFVIKLDNTPFGCQRKMSPSNDTSTRSLDPLSKAIASFLSLLSTVVSDFTISQRTLFPLAFMEQLILCVKEDAGEVLKFLPHETIMSLIKTTPECLSYEFLLAVGDNQTAKGRKILAKALCQLGRAKKLAEHSMI